MYRIAAGFLFLLLAFPAFGGDKGKPPDKDKPLAPAEQYKAIENEFNESMRAYQKAFNTPPSTYSPEGYDAANAMIQAIKDAKSKGQVTRQSVEDAVKNLNYKGITTTIKFQSNGEVEQQVINLYQEKNGVIGLVGDMKKAS